MAQNPILRTGSQKVYGRDPNFHGAGVQHLPEYYEPDFPQVRLDDLVAGKVEQVEIQFGDKLITAARVSEGQYVVNYRRAFGPLPEPSVSSPSSPRSHPAPPLSEPSRAPPMLTVGAAALALVALVVSVGNALKTREQGRTASEPGMPSTPARMNEAEQQLDSFNGELSDLAERVERLERAPAPASASAPSGNASSALKSLQARMDDLEAKVGTLQKQAGQRGAPVDGDQQRSAQAVEKRVSLLQADHRKLDDALSHLLSRVASIESRLAGIPPKSQPEPAATSSVPGAPETQQKKQE